MRETGNYRFARIMVIGIGGGGGNAVNRMQQVGIKGVEMVAVNTDAQVLEIVDADRSLQIGEELTGGLGAGGEPEIGKKAAQESEDKISNLLEGVDMLFVTCGMGGGTGTGATPVIAGIAQEKDILTTGIVTKPFSFEGRTRAKKAEQGIENLAENVDTIITISNDKLLEVASGDIPITQAFELADEILKEGVKGISDLITIPGMINLDFADIKNAMKGGGAAMMGIGEGEGDGKTKEAARNAISSPLLEGSIQGAQDVILNVTGGPNLSLEEVTEAASLIKEAVSEEANIVFGTTIQEDRDLVRLTVIATGFELSREEEGEEDFTRGILGNVEGEETGEDQNLDIPTFLRRQ